MAKTHWKKLHDYNYLGAYMMPEDGTDIILTIKDVKQELVTGTDGKKDKCTIITFTEANTKPLIANATNCKAIQKLTGSAFIEDWKGNKIQLYVAQVNAFGDVTDAIRIRDFKPAEDFDPAKAIAKLNAAKSLVELQAAYLALPKNEQAHPAVVTVKDDLKNKLK